MIESESIQITVRSIVHYYSITSYSAYYLSTHRHSLPSQIQWTQWILPLYWTGIDWPAISNSEYSTVWT